MADKIDFVVLWVDDSDKKWQEAKKSYEHENRYIVNNGVERYRDWGLFHYWFRGVEKHAGWVNKVHIVTEGHLPKWLNVNHPKINIVTHKDLIPAELLPTFSARPIELNLHKIPGLSEKFVYFNDDMFIIKNLSPDVFFKEGIPTDMGIRNPISGSAYTVVFFNILVVLSEHFKHINPIYKNPLKWINPKYGFQNVRNILLMPWREHLGFYTHHRPTSYLIEDYQNVWACFPGVLEKTCESKFREKADVNHQIFRWYRLMRNKFEPAPLHKIFKNISLVDELSFRKNIRRLRAKVVCLNDNELTDFETLKPCLREFLEHMLPVKSSFEIDENATLP